MCLFYLAYIPEEIIINNRFKKMNSYLYIDTDIFGVLFSFIYFVFIDSVCEFSTLMKCRQLSLVFLYIIAMNVEGLSGKICRTITLSESIILFY